MIEWGSPVGGSNSIQKDGNGWYGIKCCDDKFVLREACWDCRKEFSLHLIKIRDIINTMTHGEEFLRLKSISAGLAGDGESQRGVRRRAGAAPPRRKSRGVKNGN